MKPAEEADGWSLRRYKRLEKRATSKVTDRIAWESLAAVTGAKKGKEEVAGIHMRLASRALYNHRHTVIANAKRLRSLFEAVGRERDLSLPQWCHL